MAMNPNARRTAKVRNVSKTSPGNVRNISSPRRLPDSDDSCDNGRVASAAMNAVESTSDLPTYVADWELADYMTTESPVRVCDLVTLAKAAEIAGKTFRTIQRWNASGILPTATRERHQGPGGLVLVRREDAERLRDNPPRPGPNSS
jgi:hypothetical protein